MPNNYKEMLKNYLLYMKRNGRKSAGPFELTFYFLKKHGLDRKRFFKEVVSHEQHFQTVVKDDFALLYTVL